jgi:hypothetical protein
MDTYVSICHIFGPAEEIKDRFVYTTNNRLSCIASELAAVEYPQMMDSVVPTASSIGLQATAALTPNTNAGRVNMPPLPLFQHSRLPSQQHLIGLRDVGGYHWQDRGQVCCTHLDPRKQSQRR